METIKLNTMDKVEKVLRAGTNTHMMDWASFRYTKKDGAVGVRYMVYYRQRR